MNPTLKNLDVVYYAAYGNRKIRAGDVIIMDVHKDQKVIHRVLSVSGQGIITRGDHNISADPWILSQGQIAGRVVRATRGHKEICIHGGFWGRTYTALIRHFHRFIEVVCRIIKPLYDIMANSGILKSLPIRTRILIFHRPEGAELHLMIGEIIIGRKKPASKWQIRPPFRLVLEESALPKESDFSEAQSHI